MSISITIDPETVVKGGARWRVLDSKGQASAWLGSGEVAEGLEPCHYRIEFTPVMGWKEPKGLKIRSVDGFTNCKIAAYKPLSFYEPGKIPPQTAWHNQLLEFMILDPRSINLSTDPGPKGELFFDSGTGHFKYKPAPEDKFPFLVTLVNKNGVKKQIFEVTPMPILPPEVDVFGGKKTLNLQMARPAALEEGPAMPFSIVEPILASTFLDTSVQGVMFAASSAYSAEEPTIDTIENEAEMFNNQKRITRDIRITGEIVILEKGSEPYDMIHENPAIKHLDIYAETLTIRSPLHLPQTNVTICARELGFEDQDGLPSYLSTTPADYATPARPANREPIKDSTAKTRDLFTWDAENNVKLIEFLKQRYGADWVIKAKIEKSSDNKTINITDKENFISLKLNDNNTYLNLEINDVRVDKFHVKAEKDKLTIYKTNINLPCDGKEGAKAGDVFLHIESFHAPVRSNKRFIMTGARGQDPGKGLDGSDGSVMAEKSSYGQANMEGYIWKIVYGVHYSKGSGFVKTKTATWGMKVWPTDGENATPAGIPGKGGDGGNLTATLDLASLTYVRGGDCGKQDRVYKGGAAGVPRFSVMVESWNKHNEPFGDHSWGWNYLKVPGWNQADPKTGLYGYMTNEGMTAVSPAGQNGSTGKAGCANHPLSWLHPLLLNKILEKGKDCYLRGDFEAAREKIAGYAELLDIYQGMGAWKDLEDATRLELYRIRNEIAGLLARLSNHQDYFGKSAGWVPLLSFEVSRTIFDNEIDRAIEVLYLTYWLREKAKDDRQRVDALEQLQVKLKQEIEDLKSRYAKAAEAVPQLEKEASEISNNINLLQEKLKNLEDELRRKAEEKLEEPWWKTGLKIAGTLCSVVPVYQPALGAVGGFMKLGADFDKDDPWKAITGMVDISTAFSNARVEQKKNEYELVSKKVDTKSKEFKALKSAQNLQAATTALSKGLEGVASIMAERQAPKSEVDLLLQKLEAESEEFKQLSGEISALLERKMDFAKRLANTMQIVAEIPNVITDDLLAIDSAGSAMAKGKNVLHDGRLVMHLDAMERRTKERLLKYHYYLAKSYEYRLLQRYPGQLDLNRIFEEMERLAQLNMQGDKPYQLSKTQFDSLKGVYQEMLASISEEIFHVYNENPPELSAPRRFSLSGNEIKKLNDGEDVSLNLMDLGLFQLREENVRIVDLEVENPEVSIEGVGERHWAEVDIRFEHSGISHLRQAGRAIRFCHSAWETANPIAWGARYDAVDKRIDPIKPSPASDSLLRSLLKSDTAATMMLYSRPAAWANITVRKEVNAESGIVIRLKALRLKVSYDFTRKLPGIRIIHLKVVPESENLKPYFILDKEDRTNRMDGRGDFYRAYESQRTIQVVAQDRYGRWKFDQWKDGNGNMLGKSPCLTVDADEDREIRAEYILTK